MIWGVFVWYSAYLYERIECLGIFQITELRKIDRNANFILSKRFTVSRYLLQS